MTCSARISPGSPWRMSSASPGKRRPRKWRRSSTGSPAGRDAPHKRNTFPLAPGCATEGFPIDSHARILGAGGATMFRAFEKLLLDPYPHRTVYLRLVKGLKLYGYERRLLLGAVDRPHYAHCLFQGASLARRLGLARISALEFGVARGKGLICLERHASEIARITGVGIDIYGFDTGEGLPPPEDYRDLPYHWQSGFYKMDLPRLKARLRSAQIVLGDLRETGPTFVANYAP